VSANDDCGSLLTKITFVPGTAATALTNRSVAGIA
jgi:hypothetical protein